MTELSGEPKKSLRANLPSLFLLVFVLFFQFTARIIYSPLLLSIEESLGLGHTQASAFFLYITIGYAAVMIVSGFVAAAIGHRRTILLSVSVLILGLVSLSLSSTLPGIRGSLVLLGAGAGLYFPSGIPTLTALVEESNEGKALAIHEVGPNLAFVLAPIGAIFALRFLQWQSILLVLAGVGLVAGVCFLAFARGGRFRGKPPHLANAKQVLRRPSFWFMALLFALGAGAGLGVFSVMPTYLVSERGLRAELVNTLVGLSRISSLGMIFAAGYLVDRYGARRVIMVVMAASGIATVGLSLASQPLVLTVLFVQPILTACFFPAGFAVISRIAPRELHNLTISFMFPIGYAVGAGLVPLYFGYFGDHLTFALGFRIYGVLVTASAALPLLIRFHSPAKG